ncbi:MAG TPA: 50S ribosomal protein L23 [Phaeodactylibacter sp.]|nr:50S ribosomal protein L23 [Phaeodactylibacter sp.]
MAKKILVKPVITEKAEDLSENMGQYTFIVNRKANKVEIRKAIEEQFNVAITSVNTINMPAKAKSRNTRSGVLKGSVAAYKKAIVTLAEGETIDLYGEM